MGEHGIMMLSRNQTSASLSRGASRQPAEDMEIKKTGLVQCSFRRTKWAAAGGCDTQEQIRVCDLQDGMEVPAQAG